MATLCECFAFVGRSRMPIVVPSRRNWEASLRVLAAKPQTGVSLRSLVDAGSDHLRVADHPSDATPALLAIAGFLRHELPIRLARRVVELDRLPSLREMPSVRRVREWYAMSAREISAAVRPRDAASENTFAAVLTAVYERHAGVLYAMAHGAYELRRSRGPARVFEDDTRVHGFLDSFYASRIGIRVIIGQYLALRRPARDGRAVGLMHTAVRPAAIAEDAVSQATALCERQYGVAIAASEQVRWDTGAAGGAPGTYRGPHGPRLCVCTRPCLLHPPRATQKLDARVLRDATPCRRS
mmetsp:Transcript_12735/g.37892  ORF Transcript_12735/g.37892 Transcript_12735/m.37892 type:complete len:298 (+) Transcript_12735:114-1007(+)